MTERMVRIFGSVFPVSLLLWGGYILFAYLGVPVHGMVLFSGAVQEALTLACEGDADLLCRGMRGFFGFLRLTLGESLAPFRGYVVLSLGLWAFLFLWQWVCFQRTTFRITFAPWKIFLLFILSLWVFHITLAGTTSRFRMLDEPLDEIYTNVKDQEVSELQANFRALQDRNCLRYAGRGDHGAGVYQLRQRCIQQMFIARVLSVVAFVSLFLFECLILGRGLLRFLRVRPASLLVEAIISVALGASGLIVILWTLSIMGVFIMPVGCGVILLLPLLFFRHTRYWFRCFFRARWQVEGRLASGSVILAWLLLSYLAFNFLSVIRPFPIGWDDLGSYLNRPRLLVSYGHFIFSMAPFQWEYLTSLGFLLFGYDSTFGTSASMMVNWSAGLLAILAIIAFVRTFLGTGGILAATLYYLLPLVGHFSFADMKTDNAVFTFGALSFLCGFIALFPTENNERERTSGLRWLFLAGIFAGFGFATKPTTIMVILAFLPVLVGTTLHWTGFIGALFVAWSMFIAKGTFNVNDILMRFIGEEVFVSRWWFIGFLLA